MQEWLEVPAAWAAIDAALEPLAVEEVSCDAALGRVLRQTVLVDRDQPPFDRVAMDGFAVRSADVRQATPAAPVRLQVVGEATPGSPYPGAAKPQSALQIMTGAALATGFDGWCRWRRLRGSEPARSRSAPPSKRVTMSRVAGASVGRRTSC
jgi:molybdopterin molybdotransferase